MLISIYIQRAVIYKTYTKRDRMLWLDINIDIILNTILIMSCFTWIVRRLIIKIYIDTYIYVAIIKYRIYKYIYNRIK